MQDEPTQPKPPECACDPVAADARSTGGVAPDLSAMMAEECRRFLVRLDLRLKDPDLTALAVDNMIGYTDQEIAHRRGCSVRTVERQLKLIRKLLREGLPS